MGKVEFKIFDMAGKMAFKETHMLKLSNNLYRFDLKGLLSGTYLLNAKRR